MQRELLTGLGTTLKAAGLGRRAGPAVRRGLRRARLSDQRLLRAPATFVVELFRAIPLLILIFFGYYVPLQYGWSIDKLWALVIGLTLYNGSVLAEIFRAGMNAVPRGQTEGAYAIGLRKNQVLRLILLPQAFRVDAAGDRQPARGAAQGHRARASSSPTRSCSSSASRSAAG